GLFSLAGFFALTPVVRAIHRVRAIEVTDRVLGIFPAAARALFVMAIVLAAFVVSPVSSDLKAAVESSRIARELIDQITQLQPTLSKLSGQLGGETVPLFVTKLGEDQREDLDLPNDLQLSPDPVAERQMFDLVNEERTAVGLRALIWDDRLLPVARKHSEEMFRLKYFAHQSPVSGSPFDRLKAAGITYSRAGENLAYAQSVSVAHRGLMQSQGHRENILRPEFTNIAIGVISAGPYGRMFTQLFVTPCSRGGADARRPRRERHDVARDRGNASRHRQRTPFLPRLRDTASGRKEHGDGRDARACAGGCVREDGGR